MLRHGTIFRSGLVLFSFQVMNSTSGMLRVSCQTSSRSVLDSNGLQRQLLPKKGQMHFYGGSCLQAALQVPFDIDNRCSSSSLLPPPSAAQPLYFMAQIFAACFMLLKLCHKYFALKLCCSILTFQPPLRPGLGLFELLFPKGRGNGYVVRGQHFRRFYYRRKGTSFSFSIS